MNVKQNNKKRFMSGWFPVIVIILAILFLGTMCSKKAEKVEAAKKNAISDNEAAINVVTLELKPDTIKDKINLPGFVEPWLQVEVSTEVAGRVIEKMTEEGQQVNKGDVIAVLDSAKYLHDYNAKKAVYESAIASKKRLTNLYSSKLSNKSDLDSITAKAASAEAEMKVAALNLEKCSVQAPVSGILNSILIEEGQFIDTGIPVAEIIQIDKVKVTVGIPESDMNKVRSLTDFQVAFKGLDGKIFPAKKHFLSKTTASLARLYDLDVVIENPDHEILPGMFGRIEIIKQKAENTLSVPLFSVIATGNDKLVYIAQKNKHYDLLSAAFDAWGINQTPPRDRAERRVVKTGLQEGWMVQITEGLSEGDEVIVSGQRNMSEQQKIKIIKKVSEQEELAQ